MFELDLAVPTYILGQDSFGIQRLLRQGRLLAPFTLK
jgi:hypothetical protein